MTYGFHKIVKLHDLPNGMKVHWGYFTVRKGNKNVYLRFNVPCRSNLYRLVTHFFFRSSFSQDDAWTSISEEDFAILKNISKHRKDYSVWKKCTGILSEKGKEEAYKFFKEKAQLFGMIEEMKGTR